MEANKACCVWCEWRMPSCHDSCKVPCKQEMDAAPKVMGCPPNFLRLKQFFGSKTVLANALGVHRDTISKWDRGQASRLDPAAIARVCVMSAVAEQVARFMPTDASVGPWLLQPQPALGGEAPARLVHRDGIEAYELILQKAAAIAEPVSVGGLLDDDLRAEEERSGTSVASQDSHEDRLDDPHEAENYENRF